MFEGLVGSTFLAVAVFVVWASLQSFEGTHTSPQNHPEHSLGEHCFRGGWISNSCRSSKGGSVGARALVCAVLHPLA